MIKHIPSQSSSQELAFKFRNQKGKFRVLVFAEIWLTQEKKCRHLNSASKNYYLPDHHIVKFMRVKAPATFSISFYWPVPKYKQRTKNYHAFQENLCHEKQRLKQNGKTNQKRKAKCLEPKKVSKEKKRKKKNHNSYIWKKKHTLHSETKLEGYK